MIEEVAIAICLAVVYFVYNDVIIEVRIQILEKLFETRVEHRDGNK